MKLLLEFPADEAVALRRFADDFQIDTDQAARYVLQEYLITAGYLEQTVELEDIRGHGRA